MQKKKKVFKAISRKKGEILPTQVDYTPEMKDKIINLLGIEESLLDSRLDNHIKYVYLDDKVKKDNKKEMIYDIWGVGWDIILTEGFHFRYHPLEDCDDLCSYRFPTVNDDLFLHIKEIDKKILNNYYILFDFGWTLFERLWTLRGFEKTLSDFYFRKKEINFLLDGILEFNIEVSNKVLEIGHIDGVFTGDDFGAQGGLLISPIMWRDLFKTRYKKLWEIYKSKGISIFHHSCGNIFEIIPDLIEIGLDVLAPIQPEAMDVKKLVKRFGRDISFFGGISTQRTLPFKSPREVRKEIINRIEVMGEHGGYIIAPSHEITSDCKSENFLILLETFKAYKEGKIRILSNRQ